MKRKLVFCGAVLCGVMLCFFLSMYRLSQLQRVQITRSQEQIHQEILTCRGELEKQNSRRILLEFPVFPKEVYVKPGDHVTAGQVLAVIDTEKTLQFFTQQDFDLSSLDLYELLGEYDMEQLQDAVTRYLAAQQGRKLDELTLPMQITAPTSGVVSASTAKPGILLTPLQPAFVIDPDEEYLAVVKTTEDRIAEIQIGQTATVQCTAIPDRVYDAEVLNIAPAAKKVLSGTTQQTMVEVSLKLTRPDRDLKSGYSLKAQIFLSEPEQIQVVPYEAVAQNGRGEEYVYVYRGGLAVPRKIETGAELDNGIQVHRGIETEDYLILYPEEKEISYQMVQLEEAT